MNKKLILDYLIFEAEIIYDDLSLRSLLGDDLNYLKKYLNQEFKSNNCLSIFVNDKKTNNIVYHKQKTNKLINLLKNMELNYNENTYNNSFGR